MALAVKTAEPVLVASALMVTFCAVLKLLGVKVSVPPALTDRPVLPEVRLTATVTFAVGARFRVTPKLPVWPWVTERDVGLATTEGLVMAMTVTDTADDVAVLPLASVARADSE